MYHSFDSIRVNIIEEIIDVKLAELLMSPKWIDKDRDFFDKEQAFGCKVKHNINKLDY